MSIPPSADFPIAIIAAGFSGLGTAIQIKKASAMWMSGKTYRIDTTNGFRGE